MGVLLLDLRRQLASQTESIMQLERSSAAVSNTHNSKLQEIRMQVNSSSHALDQLQDQNRRQAEIIDELR
jgi:hypothetical protein